MTAVLLALLILAAATVAGTALGGVVCAFLAPAEAELGWLVWIYVGAALGGGAAFVTALFYVMERF